MQNAIIDRRSLVRTLTGAASATAFSRIASAVPDVSESRPSQPRLVAWMYMIYPLEQWLTDYERTLDAWESGGVRGIVIGPLRFWDGKPSFDFTYRRAGATIQTFAPNL